MRCVHVRLGNRLRPGELCRNRSREVARSGHARAAGSVWVSCLLQMLSRCWAGQASARLSLARPRDAATHPFTRIGITRTSRSHREPARKRETRLLRHLRSHTRRIVSCTACHTKMQTLQQRARSSSCSRSGHVAFQPAAPRRVGCQASSRRQQNAAAAADAAQVRVGAAQAACLGETSPAPLPAPIQEPSFLQKCAMTMLAAATAAMPLSIAPVLVRRRWPALAVAWHRGSESAGQHADAAISAPP